MNKWSRHEFIFSYTNKEISQFQIDKIFQRCNFYYSRCNIKWLKNSFSLTINYIFKDEKSNELLFERVAKFVLKIMKEYKYENPKWIKSPA